MLILSGSHDPEAAIRAMLEDNLNSEIADYLGVNSAHISGVKLRGHVSPTLRKAMIKKRLIPAPPKRNRITADLKSQERIDALKVWAAERGGLSEALRTIADAVIAGQLKVEIRDRAGTLIDLWEPTDLYVVEVAGGCVSGNCNCRAMSGAIVTAEGLPPYHDGCTCLGHDAAPRKRGENSPGTNPPIVTGQLRPSVRPPGPGVERSKIGG